MAETEIVVAFQVGTTTIESRIYQAGDVFGALPSEEGVYHWYLGNGEEILPTTAVPLKNVIVWGSQLALRVTQPVPLNVSNDSIAPILHMVQGDSNSRVIAASLWDGASPFTPAGVLMLRFAKPDGTGGLYDKSEGGEPIRTFENGVSIPVAAQMLAVAGMVYCELDLYGGGTGTAAERLATFRFVIDVSANVYPDARIISSDYYSGIINAPYIGENNHWYEWDVDTNAFKDTGISAIGPEGPQGRDGSTIVAKGLFGFDVDPDTGQLRLYYTGDTPPDFEIDADGHLIYTLSPDVSVDIGKVQGADGSKGDPGITTMTQAAYDAAAAAGTIDADTWYGVYEEG